ncbi:MAG: hypothetical protein ACKO5K_05140, partial [Armatimonadota bacterium]
MSLLPGGANTAAYGISADGSTIVGEKGIDGVSWPANRRAYRWTAAGGFEVLASFYSYSWKASGDGSKVVCLGKPTPDGKQRGMLWTAATGMRDLGAIDDGESSARVITDDGNVVVGATGVAMESPRDYPSSVFRWTESGGMEILGCLKNSAMDAFAANRDASVIGGYYIEPGAPTSYGEKAWIWTRQMGFRDFREFLVERGVDCTGWNFNFIYGMSADGGTIVGQALHNGQQAAFRIAGLTYPTDSVAPSSTHSISPSTPASLWHVATPVTVSVSATDAA